ncbi:hypothetical protein Mboo_1654 [Methanoregula boonei 6A8]|uniref:Uncharacterized protein n=1 Tax=Methanoregula boonei (strain DSM 21154 / JCM 14090 / 6A8) TaxID=456442 RepID=A7I8W0_METB6|nr:hypothetical protein Mboo_1654 [Methanoregula boonei 6A8]
MDTPAILYYFGESVHYGQSFLQIDLLRFIYYYEAPQYPAPGKIMQQGMPVDLLIQGLFHTVQEITCLPPLSDNRISSPEGADRIPR